MRKMTYQQAATCGKDLKVMVTPEQSEKMQKAWFAARKTWVDASIEVSDTDKPYLFLNTYNGLIYGTEKVKFLESPAIEIELIDDIEKEQLDFASQQEIHLWVAQGNKAKLKINGEIVGFKDGVMWNFTKNQRGGFYFNIPKNWKKHIPPKLIRVNGIECVAPLESLEDLDYIFVASTKDIEGYDKYDLGLITKFHAQKMIDLKICYANEEDAITRAKAMREYEVIEC